MTGVYCDISKEIEWDSGHRVPKHQSKCRNPHGHRYRLQVTCNGRIIDEVGAPDEGMLIDFSDLKSFMTTHIHDPLDHGFIVHKDDAEMRSALGVTFGDVYFPGQVSVSAFDWKVIIFPYIPTAENIARWCWEQLEPPINAHFRGNLLLSRVTVYETPTSQASYWGHREEDD